MPFLDRLRHAFNAFVGNENYYGRGHPFTDLGFSSTYRPDRMYFTRGNERSIVTSVYNKISIDCSSIKIQEVKVDENERFTQVVNSDLNNCLTVEANKDQTARQFIQDVVESLFDEGCVAVIPIDTSIDPKSSTSYSIYTMRTGRIVQWFPDHIQAEVYNDAKGIKETITVPKKSTAIIENPYYAVMNEKNSILQRLIRKLNLLDAIDEQSGSGKLDLIIQLPYVIKTQNRKDQAEQRRKDIEEQLAGSKYGIAYTDGTEKITQLNRSVENNLLKQIEYLTSMLYSQLGITQAILDGSADEKTMTNYINRTVEPVIAAIVDEFNRKFLTKTARTQGHRIMFFNNPFKLIPIGSLADIADKFTRNEIVSSNEFRQIIGMKPVDDPRADELRNKNLNSTGEIQNGQSNSYDAVDQIVEATLNNNEGGNNGNESKDI